ncbi:MAG TPA: hypothetical protein VMD30_05445 [Tepidisphaeraceae bacterium]|nr:hypothetical protein [Tepidisphaeraceae bacterium]
MIDPAISQMVRDIHAADCALVLEFAGAGSQALAWLHSEGGSSRTILEATDRYSSLSMSDLLGSTPPSFTSPETARAMAAQAYLRAARLSSEGRPWIGVGCTATIATDRPKMGQHRVVVAVQDRHAVLTFDLTLHKGKRDRLKEEDLTSRVLLNSIARGVGLGDVLPMPLDPNEKVDEQAAPQADPVMSLWEQSSLWVSVDPDGLRIADEPLMGIIYPGSFNPLHFGHESLAAAASRVFGEPVTFELSAVNAEKYSMKRAELERRLDQFHHKYKVAVTRAPLFADKARLFPSCSFLVGFDTAVRLIDPRFYNNSPAARDAALATIKSADCHVIVAGRLESGRFCTLSDLTIPPSASGLFIELPAAEFRADITATEFRARWNPVNENSPE